MLPYWFFDKKTRNKRKNELIEILNNLVPKVISDIIHEYSELNVYNVIEFEFYADNKLVPEKIRHNGGYMIELTKDIYVRILGNRRLTSKSEIFAKCKYDNSHKYKTKYNTYIWWIKKDISNSNYEYEIIDDENKYYLTKEEYEEYKNNYEYLVSICE